MQTTMQAFRDMFSNGTPHLSPTGWDRMSSLSISCSQLHLLFYVNIMAIHTDAHLSVHRCIYLQRFVKASLCALYVTHTHKYRKKELGKAISTEVVLPETFWYEDTFLKSQFCRPAVFRMC